MTKDKTQKLPKGTKVPNHIAIIPDGNRRWARARGKNTLLGHKAGFDRAIELMRGARAMGVHTITLWGFSTENWDRTSKEINYLMRLYARLLDRYIDDARKDKVKLIHLGRKDRLPKFLLKKIAWAEEETKYFKKHVGNLAIDYGGHDEIVRAVRGIVEDRVEANNISKKLIENYMDTHDQPYPYVDLLIRTSGEQRTSGFLMWQVEYAEMYWISEHFPDFTVEMLHEAVIDYSRRRRRFGGNDKEEHFKFKPEVAARLEIKWWRLRNIPEGTRFRDYAMAHIREQWGLSKELALEAAKLMVQAKTEKDRDKWVKSRQSMKKFYKLIREEVGLAFEPELAASLQIKLWQDIKDDKDCIEDDLRTQVAEVFRISDFQAAKAAHLKALAVSERGLAERGGGEEHWDQAQNYLHMYYSALKDRVA